MDDKLSYIIENECDIDKRISILWESYKKGKITKEVLDFELDGYMLQKRFK